MWSRQLFTNPAIEGKTTTTVPDLATELPTTGNGGISADGKTYTIKIRAGRQVGHHPGPSGHRRRRGPWRHAHVQPGPALRWHPDYKDLIVGYTTFCDGFAKAGTTAAAMGAYMDKTALPGVVAKDDSTVTSR